MAMAMATTTTDNNPKPANAKRVAIVGAGVSGLAAAYKLKVHGFNVTVFEADERAGGKLRSISQHGLIWDEGANTMAENDADVSCLLDDLGLRDKQQFPLSQHKRYIVRNGKPVLIPSNPIALIKSSFLSTQSKFQILLEPFLWKKIKSSDTTESVGAFFQRHFGQEVVDYLIDPVVAGTSGGDPESLSMRHAFPELWDLERRFGSIISGAVQSMIFSRGSKRSPSGKSNRRRGSFSFLGGMQTLTNALCKEVGQHEVNLQSKVLEMSYSCDDSAVGNWSISCAPDQNKQLNQQSFDAVIMTAPLGNVKDMKIKKTGSPFLLNFIPEVSYMPVSVIISTFKKEKVKQPLEGFGVLVPAKEQENGLKTLGTLFSSMMFPDRAPEDLYLYTTFVGGSRNKELAKASRDELKQIVTSDLKQLLEAEGEPSFLTHYYWSKAFPLYGRDYGSVLEAIEKMEKELPGYFYAGNHKGGFSVGKAISSGCKAAQSVISYLDSYSEDKLMMDEC